MNLLFDPNEHPLTQEQINAISENSPGLSDQFCRLITYWTMGMLRMTTGDAEHIKQSYFQLINQELSKGKKDK